MIAVAIRNVCIVCLFCKVEFPPPPIQKVDFHIIPTLVKCCATGIAATAITISVFKIVFMLFSLFICNVCVAANCKCTDSLSFEKLLLIE